MALAFAGDIFLCHDGQNSPGDQVHFRRKGDRDNRLEIEGIAITFEWTDAYIEVILERNADKGCNRIGQFGIDLFPILCHINNIPMVKSSALVSRILTVAIGWEKCYFGIEIRPSIHLWTFLNHFRVWILRSS